MMLTTRLMTRLLVLLSSSAQLTLMVFCPRRPLFVDGRLRVVSGGFQIYKKDRTGFSTERKGQRKRDGKDVSCERPLSLRESERG